LRVAVLDEFEVEARGGEPDRYRGAEHLHAVIGPGHARGHRRIGEAGRGAHPGGQGTGEHAEASRRKAGTAEQDGGGQAQTARAAATEAGPTAKKRAASVPRITENIEDECGMG